MKDEQFIEVANHITLWVETYGNKRMKLACLSPVQVPTARFGRSDYATV